MSENSHFWGLFETVEEKNKNFFDTSGAGKWTKKKIIFFQRAPKYSRVKKPQNFFQKKHKNGWEKISKIWSLRTASHNSIFNSFKKGGTKKTRFSQKTQKKNFFASFLNTFLTPRVRGSAWNIEKNLKCALFFVSLVREPSKT